MMYLIIVFILLILMYHYDYQDHKQYKVESYISVLIILILVAGLRYRIGVDSTRYAYGFTQLPDLFNLSDYNYNNTRFHFGYIFLNAIARTISDNFVAMQFILAIIVNSIIFRFIYQNTTKIFSAVFFYFVFQYFNYNFEILRESCAVCMFLLGWKHFINNNWWKYYIFSALALLFHPSAIFVFLLPITKIRIFKILFSVNRYTPLFIVGVYILGIIISNIFFDWIRLLEIASIDSYANTYQNSTYAEGRQFNLIGLVAYLLTSIIYPLLIAYALYFHKVSDVHTKSQPYIHSLITLFLLYTYILSFTVSLKIFYRFNNYLAPFMIIAFSDVIFHKIRWYKRSIKFSYSLWMLCFTPLLLITLISYKEPLGDSGIPKYVRYYPYTSIIDKRIINQREKLYNFEGM